MEMTREQIFENSNLVKFWNYLAKNYELEFDEAEQRNRFLGGKDIIKASNEVITLYEEHFLVRTGLKYQVVRSPEYTVRISNEVNLGRRKNLSYKNFKGAIRRLDTLYPMVKPMIEKIKTEKKHIDSEIEFLKKALNIFDIEVKEIDYSKYDQSAYAKWQTPTGEILTFKKISRVGDKWFIKMNSNLSEQDVLDVCQIFFQSKPESEYIKFFDKFWENKIQINVETLEDGSYGFRGSFLVDDLNAIEIVNIVKKSSFINLLTNRK